MQYRKNLFFRWKFSFYSFWDPSKWNQLGKFITEEPHSTWKRIFCISFSVDLIPQVDEHSKVAVRECREIIETHGCSGNKMEQIGQDLYAYKAEPIGKGTWMQHKEY